MTLLFRFILTPASLCLLGLILASTASQAQSVNDRDRKWAAEKFIVEKREATARLFECSPRSAATAELELRISIFYPPALMRGFDGAMIKARDIPMIAYKDFNLTVLDQEGKEVVARPKTEDLEGFFQSGNGRSTQNSGVFLIRMNPSQKPEKLKIVYKGVETIVPLSFVPND
jgi:hypothetical protein